MPDRPIKEFDNKTPLEFADTKSIDSLVKDSIIGMVNHIPEGLKSGSDVGNLRVLGYNPKDFYTGRSPLEATSQGIDLNDDDVTYRCNLINTTIANDKEIMDDYSAGHIQNSIANTLIQFLKEELDDESFTFFQGVSYRHVLVWKNGDISPVTIPSHDISQKSIDNFIPSGQGSEKLNELMNMAKQKIKQFKELNDEYKNLLCNGIWLWGQGKKTTLPNFQSINGVSGSIISAVDLVKGIGKCAGLEVINVEGATGYLVTNYNGKVEAVLNSLNKHDFSMIHIEAPDETGHEGDFNKKVQAIEDLDKKVIAPLVSSLHKKFDEFKLYIVSDHPTPIELRTHSYDYVPFMIYDSRESIKNHNESCFNEKTATKSNLEIRDGFTLLRRFLSE